MNTTIYVRVGKHPRGGKAKVVAGQRPSHLAVVDSSGNPMPTVAFALELKVPDHLFSQAQRVLATIEVGEENVTVPVALARPA